MLLRTDLQLHSNCSMCSNWNVIELECTHSWYSNSGYRIVPQWLVSINYLFCHKFIHLTVAADREKKIMELQQTQKECIKQIKDLQHQLKVSHGQIREKDAVIAARQQEMQQLQQVTHEKDHDIEIREQQLQQLNQQLTASQQVTAQLEETIQESQEEKKHLQQQLDKVLQQSMVTQKGKLTPTL